MPLSEDEQATLKALQRKSEEPEPPPVARRISAHVDFGDAKQVALAVKHGFLTADEAEEGKKKEKEGDNKDGDDKPKRKGYFE